MATNRRQAFTIVEALSVITIIALLLTLLLPALGKARRQARLVVCASNQHQIGAGLMTYATGNSNRYPPASTWMPYIVYAEVSYAPGDVRDALIEIAGGQGTDLYFCPLWRGYRPEDGVRLGHTPETKYTGHFYATSMHRNRHYVSYYMFFLLPNVIIWPGYSDVIMDWSHSENSKGPRVFGDAESAVLSDINGYSSPGDDWTKPVPSGHNSAELSSEEPAGTISWTGGWELPFIDSNVLYGDGHVITRTTLENYYAYAGSTIFPY
ncbi:MAG: hypothetical protein QF541_20770 [Lentisphaeria bacterium]|jgi:prepilin-type processing-associated H-X9-DG protein|nr:hypothetical protein [Lentisphaeria bacterium]